MICFQAVILAAVRCLLYDRSPMKRKLQLTDPWGTSIEVSPGLAAVQ